MKEIVFIRFKNTKIGGAEKYLMRLINALKSQKSQVFSTGDYGIDLTIAAKIPRFLPSFLRFLLFLFAYENFRKKNPNCLYFSLERVLHCDIYRAGDGIHQQWLSIKNDTLFKKFKNYFNPINLIYTYIEPKLFQNAKIIIANSQMIQNSLIDTFNIPKEKIYVIYNGIPIPQSTNKQAAKASLIKNFPFLANKPLILFVGSGYERKGVKQALLMLAAIPHKNWHFLIIGKEKKMTLYQKLSKSLKIAQNVLFLGPRDDTPSFYEASDIFLFPTIYEPCSNATLEAASYQNAIITTKQNGASELFLQDYILDNPNQIAKGSEILQTLLNNPNLLKTTQQKCADSTAHLTPQNNLQQTLKVLETLQ